MKELWQLMAAVSGKWEILKVKGVCWSSAKQMNLDPFLANVKCSSNTTSSSKEVILEKFNLLHLTIFSFHSWETEMAWQVALMKKATIKAHEQQIIRKCDIKILIYFPFSPCRVISCYGFARTVNTSTIFQGLIWKYFIGNVSLIILYNYKLFTL